VDKVKCNYYGSRCFKRSCIVHIKQIYTYDGGTVEGYLVLLYYVILTFLITHVGYFLAYCEGIVLILWQGEWHFESRTVLSENEFQYKYPVKLIGYMSLRVWAELDSQGKLHWSRTTAACYEGRNWQVNHLFYFLHKVKMTVLDWSCN
jgi:hypothetical protein